MRLNFKKYTIYTIICPTWAGWDCGLFDYRKLDAEEVRVDTIVNRIVIWRLAIWVHYKDKL
jgi:hypothetical protein